MASFSTYKLPGMWNNFTAVNSIAVFILFILLTTDLGVRAATLGQPCTDLDGCDENQLCSGDTSTTCACGPGFFEDSQSCRLPKYDEVCSTTCENPLVCGSDNKCTCSSSQYYDSVGQQCDDKRGLGQSCNDSSVPCFNSFECKSLVCTCKEGDFPTQDGFSCQPKKANGASCNQTPDNECKANLTCINATCGCEQATHYYDLQDSFDCQLRKDEGEDCQNINNECTDTLECLAGTCSCADGQYFGDSQCQTIPKYDEVCSTTCENNFVCGSDNKCTCSSSQYYDSVGQQCVNKRTFNGVCTDLSQCQDTLSCVAGNCNCYTYEYKSGGQCQQKKTFNGVCTHSSQCRDTLSCVMGNCNCNTYEYQSGGQCQQNCLAPFIVHVDGKLNWCFTFTKSSYLGVCGNQQECLSNMVCAGGKCTCDSNTQYWDGALCSAKKAESGTCSSDDECMNTLTCTGGVCRCDSNTEYWDGSRCQARKTFGQDCNGDSQCQTTLSCVFTRCGCKASEYQDGDQCLPKNDKGQPCGSTSQCQNTLTCINSICNCNSDTQYWDGGLCQNRGSFGLSCTNPGQCKSTLSCIDNQCQCYPTEYRDTATDQCAQKKGHAESCSQTVQCSDAKAECRNPASSNVNTLCLCRSGFYQSQVTRTCQQVSGLQVQNPRVTVRGTDSIQLSWTAPSHNNGNSILYRIVSSPEHGSRTATATLGRISNLTPGTMYSINVESYIQGSTLYDETVTSVTVSNAVWTKPATPGQFDLGLSQVMTSPMTFGFTPSIGQVAQYNVLITLDGGTVVNRNIPSNTWTGLTSLLPAKTYGYRIVALNGAGEESEASSGIFKTGAAASSQVIGLSIQGKTANSVTLTWKPPVTPNGKIQLFVVQVFQQDSCKKAHLLSCSDCDADQQNPSFPECGSTKNEDDFTKAEVSDTNHVFTLELMSLTTYTEYTVKVFAVNEAGNGVFDEETFTTDEAVASDLLDLTVDSSLRDASNTVVGLKVSWTPGKETGLTNFTVTLVATGSGTATPKSETLNGYDINETSFPNLQAFQEYTITVVAETRLGESNPISKTVTTLPTIPGKASNIQVIPDRVYATTMSLTFECPTNRNGNIQKATVFKWVTGSDKDKYDITGIDCNDVVTVTSSLLGTFEIKNTYTFEVVVSNQEFDSAPSDTTTFDVLPKEPVFETSVVTKDSQVVPTKTTVSVAVCSSCLTNSNQGEITHAGLIVCVKSKTNTCSTSRRKRDVMTLGSYQNYPNWAEARANEFNSPYRTTPDTWLGTLKTDNPSSYVIGDTTCSKDTTGSTHCNGPLPAGKEIVVTAISCTEAGCQSQSTGFVIVTKAADTSSDDSTGMIAGIVVAVIVIIIIAVVVVFFVLRMRKSKRMKEEPEQAMPHITNDNKRPIKIREFKDNVAKLHKDSNLLFQSQFEDIKSISSEFKSTSEEAQMECNRVKNRYVDILPYDHSRVKLRSTSESEDGSDFINASYIPGLNSKREYIASQGPMHATIPHFWKMVWEQKSKVIVMLSDLMENNKMKVNLYWPENLNEPISYGDVVVEMTNFSQLNKYIIRNFKISVGNLDRRVTHFFIPGWWDFSANLTFDDVLEFAQLVRKETTPPESGPPIVHCSAGVGRTGTFIALDYFMQYIDRHSLEDYIDVFEYVLEMRKCRPRMVQAETQYIFIFDALVEVIQRKIKMEQERLYDNVRPSSVGGEENVYANQSVTENVYANAGVVSKDSVILDFSYANQAFEPDDLDEVELHSNDKPTTVL